MQKKITIKISDISSFKESLVEYARFFELACVLDSNSQYFHSATYNSAQYDLIAGYAFSFNDAMKIIDEYEIMKRGLYSGAVGYISPSYDIDLSIVIHSLQYNAGNKYLSYMVGSAINTLSNPQQEYEECLLKAYGIKNGFNKINYA